MGTTLFAVTTTLLFVCLLFTLWVIRQHHLLLTKTRRRLRDAHAVAHLRARQVEAAEQEIATLTHEMEDAACRADASARSYQQLLDTAAEGIWTIGADGRTTYVNPRLAQMLGYQREEILHRPLVDFLDDAGRREAIRLGTLEPDAVPAKLEFAFRRRDGGILWAMVSTSVICDRAGKPVGELGMMTDVTARRQAEKQLELAKNAAIAANEAKGVFLANISHEIRTPLNAILGFSDLLLNTRTSPAETANYLATISRNGEALARLIDDVLDMSKIEAGKLEVEPLPVCVRDLADDICMLFRDRATAKGIRLETSVDDGCPAVVCSDPTRLRQILINLVGNALKFTKRGRIAVHYRLIRFADQSPRLHVSVSDTGGGIPLADQTRIFGTFTQSDQTITRRFGGTGLGLALSRRLAHALGGELTLVASEPGRGSTFELTVDAGDPAAAQLAYDIHKAQHEAHPVAPVGHRLTGLKVLVVDDAVDNRMLVISMLQQDGAVVDVAKDGYDGLQRALAGDYAVVLMDLQMPGKDGYAATRDLRAAGFDRPILAVTAFAIKEELQKALDAGCNDFLTKPVQRERLVAQIVKYTRPALTPAATAIVQ